MLVFIASSFAATPLLVQGNPDAAIVRAAADAEIPVWTVEPVYLSERLEGERIAAIGHDQALPCAEAGSTNAQIHDYVARAEGRIAYQQWPEARSELDAATRLLACLAESSEASLGARVYYLRGILAMGDLADPAQAQREYARARVFVPTLGWDDAFPPDWKPPFEAAAIAPAPAMGTILLGPEGEADAYFVDGRIANASDGRLVVPLGNHLVQLLGESIRTVEVRVGAQPVVLAVPDRVSDDVLANAADPAVQPYLDAYVDVAFGLDTEVLVWTGERTVRGGRGAWEVLPTAAIVVTTDRKESASLLRSAGIGLGAAGLVGVLTGAVIHAANGGAPEGETTVEAAERLARQGMGTGLYRGGLVALGAGAVTVGLSVPLGKPTSARPRGPR